MIAIELFEEGDRSRPNAADGGYRRPRPRQRPDPALLRAVLQRAAHPVPLTIEEAQIEQGLKIIADCFSEAKQA